MRTQALFATVAALALGLAGCAGDPPPASGLRSPPAALMRPPAALPDIPADEARPEVRRGYYARSRRLYGDLATRHRGLQRVVREMTR